ncbi:hypothetical protein B0H19DRAFT_1077271 [Mycena capillaripes]|nr:hypothetical protein B0H19DRAFT_1077271 [Mycena capillaripes]
MPAPDAPLLSNRMSTSLLCANVTYASAFPFILFYAFLIGASQFQFHPGSQCFFHIFVVSSPELPTQSLMEVQFSPLHGAYLGVRTYDGLFEFSQTSARLKPEFNVQVLIGFMAPSEVLKSSRRNHLASSSVSSICKIESDSNDTRGTLLALRVCVLPRIEFIQFELTESSLQARLKLLFLDSSHDIGEKVLYRSIDEYYPFAKSNRQT